MKVVADILVVLVALVHCYILVLEMFRWTHDRTRAAFGTTPELAEATKPLAANQGLYNGFLAAGLIWSLFAGGAAYQFKVFFLLCVLVAGLYAVLVTKLRPPLFVQVVPSVVALVAVLIAG
ncbi:DUF1304 domain-containing protein [Nocardia alni]|uniref:DUF1304 domain-containing protein n=1 Tax=Nocardia alni TaxID=2815723 RepID=UPI001C23949D|nr:DUF1304 domain-containing protein [Nocardia alni]